MPREKEMYRLILENLLIAFPKKRVLNVNEVARYVGKDPRFVRKYYITERNKTTICIEKLASILS